MNNFDLALQLLSDNIAMFFVAFGICFVATPLMRVIAVRNGIVDWPDIDRKNHVGPVAYLGGVSLFLAWFGAVTVCYFRNPTGTVTPHLISLAFGAICITLTGLCDDIYGISPRVKIGGMFLAAGGLALSSQRLGTLLVKHSFGAVGLPIGDLVAYILGAALIGLIVLGGCNAVNLLDGLDGLASGVCAIACLGLLVICFSAVGQTPTSNDSVRFIMCLTILGALLGFLPYNFNPANIFLGDAGSLLLGYLCASTIVVFADQPKLVVAALVVFALPITDTALAIFRRKMRRQPVFMPDNQHIHHQLLRVMNHAGFRPSTSIKLSVMVMYLLALVFTVLGCSLVFLRWRFVMAVAAPLFAFVVVGAYKVGQRQSLAATTSGQTSGQQLQRESGPEQPAPTHQPTETGDPPAGTSTMAWGQRGHQ